MLVNLLSVAVAVIATCIPSVFAKESACKIKNLVVFGDSYADIGNVYRLTKKTWPLSFYNNGRFTNGRVWIEHVAKAKKYKMHSYAFGGATCDNNLVQGYSGPTSEVRVPGMIQQVEAYLSKSNRKDASKTLFVLNSLGNDFVFDSSLEPAAVVARVHDSILRLEKVGAKNILVVENFDMGNIPYFRNNATQAAYFTRISIDEQAVYKDFITLLGPKYVRLGPHPFLNCKDDRVNVGFLNLWDLFKHLHQPGQLKRLGITDVIQGCVSSDYKTVCSDPDKHFYWDDFHLTGKIHKEISTAVLKLL
ncbi:hypothetical protein BGZ65_003418 [Modicella reniformis]|uniref:Uncharacterized protein n=1 Tax=Modicella reniformis TaxID=1440133 RepID=A0A9P6IZJ8_9FUNG|nr:hypothetical protein BGZ65_003418 [Modicella reniformis]